MKAAVLEEGLAVAVRDVEEPAAGGWALVAPRAAGVCGTELHFLDGMIPPPHYPFVLGHEIAGVVVDAPAGSGFAAGDRVAVHNFVGCGRCRWCRTGNENLCHDPQGQLGFSLDGGFSELVRVPPENLIRLPGSVDFAAAAVLCCSGMSAVHASRLAGVGLGQTAVVNGVGGVGLSVIQVVVAAGARAIAIADSEAKAELARSVGATETILLPESGSYDGVAERVREATGSGADHFFELVGTTETMRAGIGCLDRRGSLVIIGYTGDDLVVNPVELLLSEIRVVTSVAATRHDLETAIRLAADGRLTVAIDTRYPLDEVHVALDRLRARQVRGRNVLVFAE